MVDKITTPPTQNEVISKINELVDGKQDTLVSGTNIKTVNGTSLLGSGNIAFPTIDSALSTSSTNSVQNKVITSALNGKLDGFTLRFAGAWSGGVHAVNFVTIDYSTCNSENGVFIKFSMVNSHGNGQAGRFLQDVVLNVKYTGEVAGTLYRYFAVPIDKASSEYYGSHYYGDVFWVNDTTNKIVRFYVLMHQYSYTSQSPYFRLNASTKGVITQSTGGKGASEYSSGTRVWTTVNWFETDQTYSATSAKPQSGVAIASAISGKANSADLATVATSGNYNDLSNKPTIPTVNNATLTIQKNGSNVATFTANASSNVTANISVPNVTSTYTATGTDAVNGVAVSNAIATKQDTLVSGTNIKTINGTSLLGSGDIVIQSAPNLDNKSITKNTADELQTIGVINQNNTTVAIKTWTGTLAQYNAIATKDNNTLYNITDDMQASTYEAYSKSETDALLTNSISALLTSLYPVGSIYIGTQSTCPLATLISGSTWVKVSEGRVLQGSDSNHNTGTTIEAGLPNITGSYSWAFGTYGALYNNNASAVTGAFGVGSATPNKFASGVSGTGYILDFNASRSSSIYGNSNTVQPPAFVVNIWKRTA